MPQREPIGANDLRIPARDKIAECQARLTGDDARAFNVELMAAMGEASKSEDWSTVQYVLDAWWVSMLFTTHPDFEKAIAAADESVDAPLLTAAQVGELLGVG